MQSEASGCFEPDAARTRPRDEEMLATEVTAHQNLQRRRLTVESLAKRTPARLGPNFFGEGESWVRVGGSLVEHAVRRQEALQFFDVNEADLAPANIAQKSSNRLIGDHIGQLER